VKLTETWMCSRPKFITFIGKRAELTNRLRNCVAKTVLIFKDAEQPSLLILQFHRAYFLY